MPPSRSAWWRQSRTGYRRSRPVAIRSTKAPVAGWSCSRPRWSMPNSTSSTSSSGPSAAPAGWCRWRPMKPAAPRAGRWPSIPALARRSQGPLPKDADRIGARDDAPMYFGIIAAYPCFARRAKGPCGGGTPKLLIPNALATVHGVAFENSSGPRRNARSSALSRRAQRNRSSRLSMAPLTI
uniref:Uncharacterized protein n=1 Tax=Bradyrhizobium japonicum TaxID=375 RepID=Q9L8L4_BRAJP|nr:unknown [Bradyrhizobium japonicum]